MKYSGRARQEALKLILWTLAALIALFVGGMLATLLALTISAISTFLIALWVVFALFTLYFFRDPNPNVPSGPGLIVSPAHGKVDITDQVTEPRFMGGPCQRISIFLSV